MSGIGSPASGARFGTVAWNVCVASSPPGSLAVTVTTTEPWDTASTATVLPATDTEATDGSDEAAE